MLPGALGIWWNPSKQFQKNNAISADFPPLFGPKNIPKFFTTSKFHTTAELTSGPAPQESQHFTGCRVERSATIPTSRFDPHGIFILARLKGGFFGPAKPGMASLKPKKGKTGTRGEAEGWNSRDCAGVRGMLEKSWAGTLRRSKSMGLPIPKGRLGSKGSKKKNNM